MPHDTTLPGGVIARYRSSLASLAFRNLQRYRYGAGSCVLIGNLTFQ